MIKDTKLELPYIRMDDIENVEPILIIPYDINPLDEDKRIRVYCHQMLDDIVEETTLENFYFHIYAYYRQGHRLEKRFPNRKPDLENAYETFWTKMQQKQKILKLADKT